MPAYFKKYLSTFKPAVIIELEVCDKHKEIFIKCDEALEQIERNKYDLELIE